MMNSEKAASQEVKFTPFQEYPTTNFSNLKVFSPKRSLGIRKDIYG